MSSSPSPQWSQRSMRGGWWKGIKRISADYAKWFLAGSAVLLGISGFMMYRIRKDPAELEQTSFNNFIKGEWGKTVTWMLFIIAVVLMIMGFGGLYQ